MNNEDVVVYVSDESTYCNKVIHLMEEHDISYKVKNVSKDKEYMRELQRNGIYGTPALFIKGQEHSILGYQRNRILNALNVRQN
ncbi:glutaredoxin family protein [Oceanobacillus sp. FSL H7-0719]|uniref:glutaredoxin family protein n=1 Tax=Oceanobacillus sp. FSL H7-0719 TaxID=2954507 RepID=UPI003253537E